MRRIGFSTGAIARGDFRSALAVLAQHSVSVVELSALRVDELDPLVKALPTLDLSQFDFISIHAPSRFAPGHERSVLNRLHAWARQGYPIVVHPDVIYNARDWAALGDRLLLENMDKRKPIGRTVDELRDLFTTLPEAGFCFDIGHARQIDPSMTEATLLLDEFGGRLKEVHMSEVNTASRHDPISTNAVTAFSSVMSRVPEQVPIVLETLIDQGQSSVSAELERAKEVFGAVAA